MRGSIRSPKPAAGLAWAYNVVKAVEGTDQAKCSMSPGTTKATFAEARGPARFDLWKLRVQTRRTSRRGHDGLRRGI